MWTAEIQNSDYSNGVLTVGVKYTNGTSEVAEKLDMTGGSMDVLSQKVQNRLSALETTEALNAQIKTGAFTPVVPPESPEIALRAAVRHLEAVQKATDLGLLPAKTELDAAKAKVQELFTPEMVSVI